MTKQQHGLCLIIDNEKFENDVLPFREGSQIDANNLDILFQELGFQVTMRRNLNYNDMMTTITEFSKKSEHFDAEMCIIILLSHGESDGLISAADGRSVSLIFGEKNFYEFFYLIKFFRFKKNKNLMIF